MPPSTSAGVSPMAELLNCPCCDEMAHFRVENAHECSFTWIECSNCGLQTPRMAWCENDAQLRADLTKDWNRRTPPPQAAGGEPVAIVGERGSVSWRSDRILPIGTPLFDHPPAIGRDDVCRITGWHMQDGVQVFPVKGPAYELGLPKQLFMRYDRHLELMAQARVTALDGWTFERLSETSIRVTCEYDATVVVFDDFEKLPRGIAGYALYRLAADLLATAPAQPVGGRE